MQIQIEVYAPEIVQEPVQGSVGFLENECDWPATETRNKSLGRRAILVHFGHRLYRYAY